MKLPMKKFFLSFVLLFTVVIGSAQEFSVGVDLFNRYIWRGVNLGGKSPSIQPWANVTFGSETHSFTFGTWGAFSLAGTANEEIDLYLNYCINKAVNIVVTDYFFPDLNVGVKDNYFEWGADSTGHLLEGAVSFVGTEQIPFTALFAINFYGNDARKSNGDLLMSKYAEIGYKTNINGTDFNVFMGAALDNPDEELGEIGFYLNENAGITNLGVKLSKTLEITDKFSVPVQCSFVTNPELNKVFMTFGFSF